MANNLLTSTAITRESIRLFKNANWFVQALDRQYSDQFAKSGAKIGNTINIRLPNDYIVRSGPTAVPQDTVENKTPLTVSSQKGVDVSFSSVDRSLSLDDFSTRVLAPMMNDLAGAVAADVMTLAETIPHVARAADGSNNTISPTFSTWATAGAILDRYGASRAQRNAVLDPLSQARTLSSFSGLFNAQDKIGQQYRKGVLGRDVIGFDFGMDQTVLVHNTGAYGTLPTVNGAGQTGSLITVSALSGPLNKGDIVRFAGVYSVNRITKASDNVLANFAVTANVAAGATSIPIYPALIPSNAGAPVPYQTVASSPANGAQVTSPFNASEAYRKNVVMVPEAFTMATVDLDLPRGVHEAHRESMDGISMRMVSAYNVMSDQFITRFDILYGFAALRPEWAVVVADAI